MNFKSSVSITSVYFHRFEFLCVCNMENGKRNVFVELVLRGHDYKSEGMK